MKKETSKVIKIKEKKETNRKKPTSIFAPFRTKELSKWAFDNIYNKLDKDDAFEFVLYVGQLESTMREGYSDDQE